ncbi:MAG: M20/M25/M40 family metallo-hydrolase [Clostridia bacterium]|jgi:tripeptide aminopeptidase|nr:M20/M25/M40 family metallo-hydrolase [Clostridia bacterium]
MINEKRLVESFMEMVQIDSLSKKEGKFKEYLQDKLAKLGLEVIEDKQSVAHTGSDAGNLIGRLKGNLAEVTPLLFGAHMDTVVPGCGIKPVIKDGVICSSGDTILGADDKAAIAALLEALLVLKETKAPHGDIEAVFTVGEEIGLVGAKHFDLSLLSAPGGYVLDAGGAPGTIINRGPAQDVFTAVIHGRAAHAGINPETGVSAIQVAARAIDRMKLLRVDPETTANIGMISGGQATNIVTEKVTLDAEARSLSVKKLEEQTRHMLECLKNTCEEFGARLEIKKERQYPAFFVEEHAVVVETARKAALSLGLDVRVQSTGGGSDTHYFNEGGIHTVNLGIGMNKVHTTEEEIRIRDLVDLTRFIVAIIAEHSKQAKS